MAIKKLIEVWDGKNLLKNNIKFLKRTTKEVHLPLSENNKNITPFFCLVFKTEFNFLNGIILVLI